MQFIYRNLRPADSGLPEGIWTPFAAAGSAAVYERGRIIYMQNTDASQFYYILRGKAKAYISSDEGGERLLTVYRAGDIMGEAAFFDEQPRVSSAMALTRCTIAAVDRPSAERIFSKRPDLAMAMLKYLARTVRLLSGHVDDMSFLTADKRIARFLLTLPADSSGGLHCTQEEIGFAVGVTRITVSRVLSDFAKRGWLKTGYRFLSLVDTAALRKFAKG